MKMLVCLKPVPETEGPVRIAADERSIEPAAARTYRMNRHDEPALEQALLLRDASPSDRLDVISAGPAGSEAVLKRALGLGADHAIHILTENDRFLDPTVTAAWLAAAARDGNYDLWLAGVMSEDGMHGQVGPLIAGHLSLPCATAVMFNRIELSEGSVQVERMIAEGLRESLRLRLPAMLTVQGGLEKLRYPSLSNILRAREQEPAVIPAGSGDKPGPGPEIVRFKYPQKSRAGLTLTGDTVQKARQFLRLLQEKALLG